MQSLIGVAQSCKLGKLHAKVLHGVVHHARLVSQYKLGTLVERAFQRLARLKPAMRHHHGFKVSFQCSVFKQRGIKPPPDQCFGRAIVFQQLVVQRQAHLLQGRHRCTAQQGGKPAVKGSDLHRAAIGQHTLV